MKQNNFKIAITGGIGSGKSTVAGIVKELGFKVLSCDEIYSELKKDKQFIRTLCKNFGDVINPYGEPDYNLLANIVFSDNEKLALLNSITHPLIFERAFAQMNEGICFLEVPVLFECGYETLFDKVIVVMRNLQDRLSAVAERDNLNENDVKKRINCQINYEKFNFEKYYVIHNDSNLQDLYSKVKELTDKIINKT